MKSSGKASRTAAGDQASPWAVIFDWDGVIVESSDAHRKSWELLAAEEGRSLPPDHFQQGFGMKNPEIIRDLLKWTDNAIDIERLSRRKEELYRRIIREQGLRLVPGAVHLLAELQAKSVPMAIASSTERKNITLIMRLYLPRIWFPVLVTAEDVKRSKPEPDVFLTASHRLGVPPESCVVVEDAPAGIAAARRAGMKAVAVATTRPAEMLADADMIVPDLTALDTQVLARLASRAHP